MALAHPITRSDRMAYRTALRRELDLAALQSKLTELIESPAPRSAREADRSALPGFVQRLLDSTTGGATSGGVLVRTDIEDVIYAIVVTMFPLFERLRNGRANGLNHSWNTAKATGQATDDQEMTANDTDIANDDTGVYARNITANIAEFLIRRGVTFKEALAVEASGMTYSPEAEEIELGVMRLTELIQRQLLQGNFAVTSGTASTEYGRYSTRGFDGFRIITGPSLGAYLGQVQIDQDLTGQTYVQAINTGIGKVKNLGGRTSLIVMSSTAKAELMNQQEGKQRALEAQLIPGVQVDAVATVAGKLPVVDVPGLNALGTYNRTSDGALVEDIYLLDERMIVRRWLGSPDITVLEIPPGVSGALTRTFLLYAFNGLQVVDGGVFQGKVRVASTQ